MNIPGFTAGGALYSSYKHYTTSVHTSAHPLSTSSRVTPQLSIGCFVTVAARTYKRCVGLGHDSGVCAEVAVDLGASVCDD